MKKNPRDYKKNGKQYSYILDSVYSDDKDVERMTDKERIQFVLDTFYDEKYKDDRRRMSTSALLTEWIQGLPSAISVAFSNYDIQETGKSWGYCKTPRSAATFVNMWWQGIAGGILQLARIYAIDMSRFR